MSAAVVAVSESTTTENCLMSGMTLPKRDRFPVEAFVENFGALAEAEGGIKRLRDLVLHLAVRGFLVPQLAGDPTGDALVAEIERARHNLSASTGGRARDDLDPVPTEGEQPFATPLSWRWVRLGHLGALLGGGTPAKSNTSFWKGPIPWVSPKDMKRPYIDDAEDHISTAAVEGSAVKLIPTHSLLFVVRGMILAHSFPVALTTKEVTINQDMKALVLAIPEMAEYVLRVLWSARARVLDNVERSTHGTCRLETELVEELLIPLPPLAEQKRIVAKVDQLMALCDDLEARQTKKRETSTRLTKSVLEALTSAEGRDEFDSAWKRMAENFNLVFDGVEKVEGLRKALLQLAVSGHLGRGAPTWTHGTMEEVAECRLGKMLDKAKNRGSPMPYLRNTNVHWFRLELADIKLMPFQQEEVAEYELRAGDLVVCEGGHGIGRCAVWAGELKPMMFQKALHRLRPRPLMNSRFLAYQVKAAADAGVLATLFTGAGIPHLTGRKLAQMQVVIPPLDQQAAIVAKVEHLMKVCDQLERHLHRAEDRAGRLVVAVIQHLEGLLMLP